MQKIVTLTKLKEVDNPVHANNIAEGSTFTGNYIADPVVGERFHCGSGHTSTVQEIIDNNTFRTHNSIYKWEITEQE